MCIRDRFQLSRRGFKYLGEAGVGLGLGALAGLILSISHGTEWFGNMVQFDESVFFIVLLPPIIFEAGYNMQRRYFFRNLGTICTYAFAGTFISTFVIGGLVWAVGNMGLAVRMSMLECLIFGALISATDPVTVLAVFSKLKADPDLFSFVFGESVLNDAVAIVLYKSLGSFRTEPFTATACVWAVGEFFEIFVVSFLIGVGTAMALAYLCKKVDCSGNEELEHAELAAVLTTPYIAYLAAEALEMSGIVTILFCGIAMSLVVRPNISPHARDLTKNVVKTLAHIFETYVFVYLGLSLFTLDQVWDTLIMSVYAIVICLFARMCNVYPLTWLLNKFIKNKIGPRKQFTLWFSGLRGAIAFVLALQASEDFASENGQTILTTTIMVIFFTVFVFGGNIWPVLEKLELRQPADDGEVKIDPFLPSIYLLEELGERQDGDLEDEDFDLKCDEAIEALRKFVGEVTEDIRLMEDVKAGTADEQEISQLLSRFQKYAHLDEHELREEHWRHETGAWIECLCNGLIWFRDKLSAATLERDRLRQSMRAGSGAIQMAVLRTDRHSTMDDEDVEDNRLTDDADEENRLKEDAEP
eukprot:TRINITY_DN1989_c0_g1_i1.p1 TRINITY_DN1989_c0_g1~~TRINITY_DN1989_c0_g1_i1.p1  ORF type:complete len:586 (+),score=186.49 TRINITY_DN1989_c0_g1_i1:147-1904(+)